VAIPVEERSGTVRRAQLLADDPQRSDDQPACTSGPRISAARCCSPAQLRPRSNWSRPSDQDDLVGAGTQRSDGQPRPYPSKSGRELSDVPTCLPTIPSDQTINRRARPDPGFPRLDVAHLPNFDLGATGAGPAIKTTWLAPVPSDQTVNRGHTRRKTVGNCPTCPPACRRSPRISAARSCSPAQLRPRSNWSRPSDQDDLVGAGTQRSDGQPRPYPSKSGRELSDVPTCLPTIPQDFRGSKLLTCPTSTSEQLEQAQRSRRPGWRRYPAIRRSTGVHVRTQDFRGSSLPDVAGELPTIPSDQTVNRRARPDPGFPRLDVAHLPNFDLGATGAGPAIRRPGWRRYPAIRRSIVAILVEERSGTVRRAQLLADDPQRSDDQPACTSGPRISAARCCSPAQLRPRSNWSRPSDQDDLVGAGTQRSDGQPRPYRSKSGRELPDVPTCLPTIPSDQTVNRRARPDPGFPRLEVAHLPTCSPAQLRPSEQLEQAQRSDGQPRPYRSKSGRELSDVPTCLPTIPRISAARSCSPANLLTCATSTSEQLEQAQRSDGQPRRYRSKSGRELPDVAGGLAPAPPIGSFGGARGSARPPWLARFQHLSLCPCHHHHVSRKTAPRPALGADGGDFRRNAPSDRTDKHRQASVSCIARVPYGVPTKTPQEGPAAGRGSIFWRAVAGRPAARLAHSARIFRGGGVPSDQTVNRRARPDPGFPRLEAAHLPNFDLGAT
jgi:hypothetical protein